MSWYAVQWVEITSGHKTTTVVEYSCDCSLVSDSPVVWLLVCVVFGSLRGPRQRQWRFWPTMMTAEPCTPSQVCSHIQTGQDTLALGSSRHAGHIIGLVGPVYPISISFEWDICDKWKKYYLGLGPAQHPVCQFHFRTKHSVLALHLQSWVWP